MTQNKPTGVGFVDFSDDFGEPLIKGEDDDDELIDEDTLLTEEDLRRPVNIRQSCTIPPNTSRPSNCVDSVRVSSASVRMRIKSYWSWEG